VVPVFHSYHHAGSVFAHYAQNQRAHSIERLSHVFLKLSAYKEDQTDQQVYASHERLTVPLLPTNSLLLFAGPSCCPPTTFPARLCRRHPSRSGPSNGDPLLPRSFARAPLPLLCSSASAQSHMPRPSLLLPTIGSQILLRIFFWPVP
jgi:hypothetical protein